MCPELAVVIPIHNEINNVAPLLSVCVAGRPFIREGW